MLNPTISLIPKQEFKLILSVFLFTHITLLAKIPGVAPDCIRNEGTREINSNNHNLLRFSSPVKDPPVLTV
jgi:hypothetical protein